MFPDNDYQETQTKVEKTTSSFKIETDEQIIDLIESELDAEEFKNFIKIFFLYSKNIISFCEFVTLTEKFLIKLDKNVLQIF